MLVIFTRRGTNWYSGSTNRSVPHQCLVGRTIASRQTSPCSKSTPNAMVSYCRTIGTFDSLIYCRKNIPKQQSYTLGDIYSILFDKPLTNGHSALPDALQLREILAHINAYQMAGPIYPSTLPVFRQSNGWVHPVKSNCSAKIYRR